MTIAYATLGLAGTCDDRDARAERCVADGTVYPGRLVYRTGVSGYGSDARSRKVKLPATADMTARVLTFTPTWSAGIGTVTVRFRGAVAAFAHTYLTSLTASLTVLAAKINEWADDTYGAGLSIVAANSGGTALTITVEIPGESVQAWMEVEGSVVPTATAGTQLLSLLVGMVGEEGSVLDSSSVANFADKKAVPVYSRGKMNIARDTTGALTPATQLYLDTASGKEGMITSTSDAYAIWLPPDAVAPVEAPATATMLTVGNVAEVYLNINALRSYVGA